MKKNMLSKYLIFIEYFFSQKFKMAPIVNMAFFLASFSRSSCIRQKLQKAKVFAYSLKQTKKKKKKFGAKKKFKMAAKFKMATKTKFACENSCLSFIEIFFLKNSTWRFFCHLFLGAFIFVRNCKMVKFLHILNSFTGDFDLPKRICFNGLFWFSFDKVRHFLSKFSTLVTSQKKCFLHFLMH
jgi:hypothetical protein